MWLYHLTTGALYLALSVVLQAFATLAARGTLWCHFKAYECVQRVGVV